MRFLTTSVLLFFFACPLCLGQTSDPAVSATVANSSSAQPTPTKQAVARDQDVSPRRSQDEAIRQKLKEACELNFDGTPWREIEKELETKYEINIELSSSAKDDSLSHDEPFTVNMTGLSLANSLRMMLEDKNATYIIKDELVLVISLNDVENTRYFSHFFINVRPLLATITEHEKDRIGHLVTANGDARKSGTTETAGQPVEFISAESLLLDAVHTFRFERWKDSGQGSVQISIIGGYAVVHCDDGFADGLRDFLADLKYHISRN